MDWTPEDALLVVDVQNDFADPQGSLYVKGAEEIFPALDALLDEARRGRAIVAYSKDWHPGETPHFRAQGGPWPAHCVINSWGAELSPRLRIASPALFIHKGSGGEDGYSAFSMREPLGGETRPTGLDEILRRLGVRRVTIAGLATDYCVRHTALDALEHGFTTTVVGAAVRAVDLQPGDGERALQEIRRRGGSIMG